MVIIHYFLQEIVDIDFCSRIHYCFYFVKKIGKFKTFRLSQFIKCDLTVDTLNNRNLHFRFIGNRSHTQIFRTFYFVFVTMCLYDFNKFFAVTLGFPCSDSRYILQFFNSYRISRRHSFERRILKYNIRRQLQLLGYFFTQIF